MTARPLIFISAVSRELHSARQLVANTLTFLGYQPIWQDIFGTQGGDLRGLLRQQIDQCKGVVQLVGRCYGAEPPAADSKYGRVSYTQYEALYARQCGKKVWYLFIDEQFPSDICDGEPEEKRELQASYRRSLQSDTHVFHPLTSTEGLEASVLKLRDDLTRLRRGVKQWAFAAGVLLLLSVALGGWILEGQQHASRQITETRRELAAMQSKMDRLLQKGVAAYPEVDAQMRRLYPEVKAPTAKSQLDDQAAVQESVYVELGKRLGVDAKVLREKLPEFAQKLKSAPNATTLDRANAAYVQNEYDEAERLALQAVKEAEKPDLGDAQRVVKALELAGRSAQRRIQYDRAMQHFLDAAKFSDRNRDLEQWATLQDAIADLLLAQGKYRDAEKLFLKVVELRARLLGPDHHDTLQTRQALVSALYMQDKHAEAEDEARRILQIRENLLGPDHPDTLASRCGLANTLHHEGKYVEAEALYREAIGPAERVLGPEDGRTLSARDGLANALSSQGKDTEAEPLYREVVKLDQKVYGPAHPYTLFDRMNLATTLQAEGKYPAAETEYRAVIALQEKVLDREHPDTLMSRNNLAELLDDEEKYPEAEAECAQIIVLEEKVLGATHSLTLNSRGNLAVALIAQGKFPDAEIQCREVLSLLQSVLGPQSPDTILYTMKFAKALFRQHKTQQAVAIAKQAEERARNALGDDHPVTREYARFRRELQASK